MKIMDVPMTVTEWDKVEPREHGGEKGASFWRVFESGNIRVRVVDYSAGYIADHWCPRGHVLYVLEGEFGLRLKGGREVVLRPGMSFQSGDDEADPHLGFSPTGARVFIVD